MARSPKGSLKIFLEHSLAFAGQLTQTHQLWLHTCILIDCLIIFAIQKINWIRLAVWLPWEQTCNQECVQFILQFISHLCTAAKSAVTVMSCPRIYSDVMISLHCTSSPNGPPLVASSAKCILSSIANTPMWIKIWKKKINNKFLTFPLWQLNEWVWNRIYLPKKVAWLYVHVPSDLFWDLFKWFGLLTNNLSNKYNVGLIHWIRFFNTVLKALKKVSYLMSYIFTINNSLQSSSNWTRSIQVFLSSKKCWTLTKPFEHFVQLWFKFWSAFYIHLQLNYYYLQFWANYIQSFCFFFYLASDWLFPHNTDNYIPDIIEGVHGKRA